MLRFIILTFCILTVSCKNETNSEVIKEKKGNSLELKYAKGFKLVNYNNYSTLEIIDPWPNADKTFTYALVNREIVPQITLNKDEFDAIILTPVKSIVVTSTTHIPSLELLDEHETLVGFPDMDYVSSLKTRELIDSGKVRELGANEGLNTEVMLELNPDLVVGFGVDGVNKTFETLQKSNIPVIYNGDWVEKSVLAKAEWIKFFGVLYNNQEQADSIFNTIESNYNNAKKLALQTKSKPTVLSGAMHKDIWYLPYGSSPEAQLLKDANVDYLWSNSVGSGSLALNFETVFSKAKDAQIWLNPSYYGSYEDLKNANEHYTQFAAFKNKRIYTFSNTKGDTGGVLYYELGIARPDLVLKDLIKICHPNLLENYKPNFFQALQ